MTTRSKVMTFAGFGLAAAVGITGCGSGSAAAPEGDSAETPVSTGTPKEKVLAAFESLEASSNAGFTLTLDSTTEDLKKLDAAQPKAERMTADEMKSAQQILTGKVTMNLSAPDGKTFGDSAKSSTASQDAQSLLQDPAALEAALKGQGAFAMSVVQEDAGLFEFVTRDGVIYVRADAAKIASLSGQSLDSAESSLGSLPPVIATPAQKLLDGQWVSLDLIKTVKALDEKGVLDELELPEATVSPAVDEAKLQAFIDTLETSFDTNAKITEIDGGDQGDGYRVTAPARKIARAVQNDLISLVGQDSAADIKSTISDIPNKNISFDIFVQDGKLSGVNVDLGQFLTKPVKDAKFAINVDVDADADAVQIPGDVTAVDVDGILSLIPADTFSSLGAQL